MYKRIVFFRIIHDQRLVCFTSHDIL